MSLPAEVYKMVSMQELDQWWLMRQVHTMGIIKHTHPCPKCRKAWEHEDYCSTDKGHVLTCDNCRVNKWLTQ